MFQTAVICSSEMASRLGSFPKYTDKVWESDIIKSHFNNEEIEIMKQKGLRNCSLLSIAPTGSIATLLGESGGCEPEYATSFTRRTVGMTDNEDRYYTVYCKALKEYLELHPEDTNNIPSYFIGSAEVSWKDRVKAQAVMQAHVDTAISSTVNLPQSATKEDITGIYLEAWRQGLKGITIFRDGCKRLGILTTGSTPKESETHELMRGDWKPLAEDTIYYKKKLRIGCGDLKLFIGWSEKEQAIQDLYVKKSGNGGCERLEESTAIAMSAILRLGGSIDNINKAFRGVGTCPSFATARAKGKTLSKGNSCGDAILNAVKEFNNEMTKEKKVVVHVEQPNSKEKCPECGADIIQEGGCVVCKSCGWSKCG